MNNSEDNVQELSLGEILQELFDHKIFIIAVTLIVGIITYGVTCMIPETFTASTSLIVQGPEIPITGEATPLRVEMLEALTLSTDIKMKVYRVLQDNKSIDSGLSFKNFQQCLETSVAREKGLDPKMLPCLN